MIPFILGTIIDLTYSITPDIPTWSGKCGFTTRTVCDYDQCPSDAQWRVQGFTMFAGIGTHMDAPAHCFPGSADIAQIPVQKLIAPCVVLDVSAKADAQYSVSAEDILLFEQQHGLIPAGSWVLVHTGWSRHWATPEQYRNNHQFPCIGRGAAELLLERNVIGVGIDTLSPDRPEGWHVHQLFLGNNKYIIENVAHLDQMPPVGALLAVMPLKVSGGTESPVRCVGIVQ